MRRATRSQLTRAQLAPMDDAHLTMKPWRASAPAQCPTTHHGTHRTPTALLPTYARTTIYLRELASTKLAVHRVPIICNCEILILQVISSFPGYQWYCTCRSTEGTVRYQRERETSAEHARVAGRTVIGKNRLTGLYLTTTPKQRFARVRERVRAFECAPQISSVELTPHTYINPYTGLRAVPLPRTPGECTPSTCDVTIS